MIAEQELARTCQEFHAARGEVVVMDPRSGEVLALANYPTFNPQEHDAPPERAAEQLPGRAVRAGIDDQAVRRRAGAQVAGHAGERGLADPGPLKYKTPYGRTITDVHGYPPLAMWDVLVKSSNIGMAMLGERMGNPQAVRGPLRLGLRPADRDRAARRERRPPQPAPRVDQVQHRIRRPGLRGDGDAGAARPRLLRLRQWRQARAADADRGTLDTEGRTVSKHKPGELGMMPEVIDPTTAAEMKRVC